jgi:nucleotide-binding universal stress UspA family protein
MYERILICTDGSALSQAAEHAGILLAAALDAEAVAYTVVPAKPHWNVATGVAMTPAETDQFDTAQAQAAQSIVEDVQMQAYKRDVKTVAVTGRGAVAESIINAAKKYRCDLIVMASHGNKGLKRLLLGSETMNVLTHSPIPVLILR